MKNHPISCHINCDMGESYGAYRLIDDSALMPYINAANIACGYHAGDPATMSRTVQLAMEHDIEIGAHPGYPDLQGFGRRNMDIDPSTLKSMVLYQIGALRAIVESHGGQLSHIKAHGALYNHASRDIDTATAIAMAVKELSGEIILFVPPKSQLLKAALTLNVPVKVEAFIDRKYNSDLSLASRKIEGSVIHDPSEAYLQLNDMFTHKRLTTMNGDIQNIEADTYCIHGDNPRALDILKLIASK